MENTNQVAYETVTIKKSTVKTIIVIAVAAVLGGFAAWYIRATGPLPFDFDRGVLNFICSWAVAIIASIVLALAVAVTLFRFIKPSLKRFMLVSAVVSVLIGAQFADSLISMMGDYNFWMFGNITDLPTVILLDALYHSVYAAGIFGLSLLFYKPIKKLAK